MNERKRNDIFTSTFLKAEFRLLLEKNSGMLIILVICFRNTELPNLACLFWRFTIYPFDTTGKILTTGVIQSLPSCSSTGLFQLTQVHDTKKCQPTHHRERKDMMNMP